MGLSRREDEVLRRVSFVVFSWVVTVGFGAVGVGVLASLMYSVDGDRIAVAGSCLLTVAVGRRIMGSRVVLGPSALTVVNPLVTYTVPYGSIAEIRGGGGATLNLVTGTGEEIYCTGFGGSVIDAFVRSADRAAERIERRLGRGRRRGNVKSSAAVTKRLTMAWIADVCGIGAVACAITAGVVGV
ncbi:hypothetical protein [Streptomyces sp. NPDC048242]|uniref:hypothetical protein n=1 Tax=Streptomyces sp. NPDC048242 TaxID=3155026 RepID=UPI00344A9128